MSDSKFLSSLLAVLLAGCLPPEKVPAHERDAQIAEADDGGEEHDPPSDDPDGAVADPDCDVVDAESAQDAATSLDGDQLPEEAGGEDDAGASSQDAGSDGDAEPPNPQQDRACGTPPGSNDTLLDLGNSELNAVHVAGDRVVVSRSNGEWTLWDLDSRQQVARGEALGGASHGLVGHTLVVLGTTGNVEVRDANDGQLLGSFTTAPTPRLSAQDAYLWAQSETALSAWSLSGELLVTRSGDYQAASVFAAADALRVARGPAGTQVIERVPLAGSAVVTSPPFVGDFSDWFTDGGRFVTVLDGILRVYSAVAVEEQLLSVDNYSTRFGGHGDYLWVEGSMLPYELSVYRVDTGEVVASAALGTAIEPIASGGALAGFMNERGAFKMFDLRGATPVITDQRLPPGYPAAFASDSSGHWAVGTNNGLVYAAKGLATVRPEPLGCGAVLSIAGARTGRTAIATADGQVHVFDIASDGSFQRVRHLSAASDDVQLSADGAVLATRAWEDFSLEPPSWSVRVFSLPEGDLRHEWAHVPPSSLATNISLATEAPNLARCTCQDDLDAPNSKCVLTVSDLDGMESFSPPLTIPQTLRRFRDAVLLSPDGTRVLRALSGPPYASSFDRPFSNIYEHGILAGSIEGGVLGWVDDSHLLVNRYVFFRSDQYLYIDTVVTDLEGEPVLAPIVAPWPNTGGTIGPAEFQAVDEQVFYVPIVNKVYSLADASTVWSGPPMPASSRIAGSHVVFAAEHNVRIQRWR